MQRHFNIHRGELDSFWLMITDCDAKVIQHEGFDKKFIKSNADIQ